MIGTLYTTAFFDFPRLVEIYFSFFCVLERDGESPIAVAVAGQGPLHSSCKKCMLFNSCVCRLCRCVGV